VNARRLLVSALLAVLAVALGWYAYSWLTFPSDRTPEGAYFRIAKAVNNDRPEQLFAYTETAAQHACFTIRNYRKKARELVLQSYPEPDRARLSGSYEAEALAPDGADVFAIHARRGKWLERLRRDVSGIAQVEIEGERASIQTARGTRYPLRRRDNGIWGTTLFTADLVAEAERAARDLALIRAAATDYDRVRTSERSRP
jgi:hypothetical protein